MNTHDDTIYTIVRAEKTDAPFIARTVMDAIGQELCINLADGKENLPKVTELFTRLGASEKSQYSYINTLIAKDVKGNPIGAIIGYDGADLVELRKEFIDAANDLLGWNVTYEDAEKWQNEAAPDEFYLDSLFVMPSYRGKGVASALIRQIMKEKRHIGKPFGLLVEPENRNAKRLYQKLGFREIGISNFFSTPMQHMQKQLQG